VKVVKKRRQYKYQEATLVFDEVKGLGYFLEIESDEPFAVVKKLGIKNFQLTRIGYNDMIAKNRPNFISNDKRQALFRRNPRWNVLPSEEKLVKKLLTK